MSVLRDSGCNYAIVKESLVQKGQMTGAVLSCVLADGTKRKFPVAIIEVDTPYFVDKVEAFCMPEPVYGLVLNNIEGVRLAENPDMNWRGWVSIQKMQSTEVNAVETKAQKIKKNKKNTLVVSAPVSKYTVSDLVKVGRKTLRN